MRSERLVFVGTISNLTPMECVAAHNFLRSEVLPMEKKSLAVSNAVDLMVVRL